MGTQEKASGTQSIQGTASTMPYTRQEAQEIDKAISLKNLVKKTGYTEETIESWYKLFTKCSNKRDFLKPRYDPF